MPQPGGDAPILATKLFVPPPRENVVARPRLRDRLAAMRGGRVTLIAAAAGTGKSTLLADWALEAPGRVAWLSLDPADDEPRRFLNYVIAALRAAQGIGEDDVALVLASRAEALQATLTELLNAITVRGAPVSLVLDDYHAIESRDVHNLLQFIVDHLPPNLHLVIATRADPPLALSRLRARGLLLELRGHDLRFDRGEAGAFLNNAMGLGLDETEIADLEQRTEGWVVGLQMAAISISGRANAHAFIQRFSGSNRYVLDYLTDEVLDRQPQPVREFLLATSILKRLSPPLCDAVMARGGSDAVLEQLDAANLFLISLDDIRYWYRYHHLFATLLHHHLTRAHDAQEIAQLHRRASAWYESNRMPESALEHSLAANDVEHAVMIVRTSGTARMLCGDMASVVRWFEQLPKERFESDIELLLAKGMALLGDWQLPRAFDCTTRAVELLDDSIAPPRHGAVYALRGALTRALGDLENGLVLLRKAEQLVDPHSFAFCLVHYFLGLTAFIEADAKAADASFAAVRSRHARPEEIMTAALAQMITAMATWWRGRPEEAIALANEIFGWIDVTESFVDGRPLDCLPLVVLATVHCSWNELDTARAYADRGMEHGRRGVMIGVFEASRTLARVALAAKDWEGAMRASFEAQRAVRNIGNNESWALDATVLAHLVLFRRWQANGDRADFAAVEQWLRSTRAVERLIEWRVRRVAGFYCDASLLLAARVLIENEQFDEGVRILDEVWPHAADTERVLAQIETLIVRSILNARRGRVDDAVVTMSRALELAAKPRAVRLFLDEGTAIQPLIERAAGAHRDLAMLVLSGFDAPVRIAARANAPEALSEREIEVLRLVASGASNQEAARKLFIAPSTVKKHLENIYAKLEVGGRVEAIGRAREMNLL